MAPIELIAIGLKLTVLIVHVIVLGVAMLIWIMIVEGNTD